MQGTPCPSGFRKYQNILGGFVDTVDKNGGGSQ